jgi:NTE family protein
MTVAFVLSGGASLGAAHAGMLRALFERGIRPDLLVGTSAGAINATFVASHAPTVATACELARVWRGLGRGDVFPASPVTACLGLFGLRDHAVPSGPLRRTIRRHLAIERIEDAPTALHIVAADAHTGEEVLLSEGPALEAVMASAAIPGVFPPVRWGARHLIDGGVVNNTPISHAIALGADRVVVLPAFGTGRLTQGRRGALGAGTAALARVIGRRLEDDLVRYAHAAELIVLPPAGADVLPTDFGHADELIADALAAARLRLSRLGAPRAAAAAPALRAA